MVIDGQLLKGSISLMVLELLSRKDMYGYQIIKEMSQDSMGVFDLKEGTLYPVLHSLEQQGLVDAYWENSTNARKRKYYHISEKGMKEVSKKKEHWQMFTNAVNNVLGVEYATKCIGFFKQRMQPYTLT